MAPDSLTTIIRRIQDLRFVVFGAYVADCFVATSHLPAWGVEYEADSVRMSPGGKALNQAVALARLGTHVTAVGTVGGDTLGQDILSTLAHESIEANGIRMSENAPTSVCVCFVSQKGETSFVWHIADDVAVTPDTVRAAEDSVRSSDAVLITFELPPAAIREAITLASGSGARVFVQPAPPLAVPHLNTLIPWDQVDVLVPNETEARAILEGIGSDCEHHADDLAAALATELAVPAVVVTLGESGCIAHSAGASRRYPAHQAVSVDTTGASDAFAASLAAHMVAGASEEEAIQAALAAAAWAIGRSGGHEAMPTSVQVTSMLSQRR
jgi:ribokinase